jgi:RNA polymerase sigma-70 factor (ECF subfamily)
MPEPDQHERFLRLFAKNEERIRRYIMVLVPNRADADDIFQETTVALWKKFGEYTPERPFFNWACRFAHFQVLGHRKREAVRSKHLRFSDAALEALSGEAQPTENDLTQWRQALATCVESLPASQRELIQLRYSTDATVVDVARRTGQAAKSLYKALARIRLRLAKCVQSRIATGGDP